VRRALIGVSSDRSDEEEKSVDEVVEEVRRFATARGRISWRGFPGRN
jgi:hypothetical protein